jgi:hypothetical protein
MRVIKIWHDNKSVEQSIIFLCNIWQLNIPKKDEYFNCVVQQVETLDIWSFFGKESQWWKA